MALPDMWVERILGMLRAAALVVNGVTAAIRTYSRRSTNSWQQQGPVGSSLISQRFTAQSLHIRSWTATN